MIFAAFAAAVAANAQNRAWEIGVGGSAMQFNRVRFADLVTTPDGNFVDMKLRHAVFGGNLYLARELSGAFALDFQGLIGMADKKPLGMAGLGLQWRLGGYFGSRHIDPFFRVGADYMYKGFDILYTDSRGGMQWQMTNNLNKEGADGRHLFAVAAGAGTNMWLNERFGIGLQGDYVFLPRPGVANSLRGTVRLMWKLGKRPATTSAPLPTAPAPVIEYRDVVVRDTIYIERERVVEIGVGEPVRDIYFDFDSYAIRPEYSAAIAKMASTLKADTSKRYLITGYADARGGAAYDETLSLNRAEALMRALLDEGVPGVMLKAVGAGKRVSRAGYREDDRTREGDRRATIEIIENAEYWEVL
jgi:outer membrane protein OmpA-like peptidoglycan-associated protein